MKKKALLPLLLLGLAAVLLISWLLPKGGTSATMRSTPTQAASVTAGPEDELRTPAAHPSGKTADTRPVTMATGTKVSQPVRTLVAAAWGSGPGEFGRSRPQEANAEGPSAFTLDSQGKLLVLDKVNGRILRYDKDGRLINSIPTTQQSPQEILTAPDGSLLVMDRLTEKAVAIFGEDGQLKGELPVTGKGLEEGGDATGLFADDKGVYVESQHSQVVRIGDTEGRADTRRPTLDGRPTRDGLSLISAGIVDTTAGRFWVRSVDRATGGMRFQRQIVLRIPFFSIVFLDSDRSGAIYVAAHVGRELEPGQISDEAVNVVCLTPAGDVRGSVVLPANTLPEESFRDLAVQDDGTLVYMERTEAGVSVRSYRCG